MGRTASLRSPQRSPAKAELSSNLAAPIYPPLMALLFSSTAPHPIQACPQSASCRWQDSVAPPLQRPISQGSASNPTSAPATAHSRSTSKKYNSLPAFHSSSAGFLQPFCHQPRFQARRPPKRPPQVVNLHIALKKILTTGQVSGLTSPIRV